MLEGGGLHQDENVRRESQPSHLDGQVVSPSGPSGFGVLRV